MTSDPPYPSDHKYIKAIRESCRSLRVRADVKIERTSIERLLLSASFTESFQRVSKVHGLAFPLHFPSVASELNFLSILSLLNFASGYRVPLHEQTGRGAWDNIRALVFSLYITSSSDTNWLSAKGLQTIGEQTIAEHMRVNVHVERPHESIPGVTVGELGGPVHKMVQLVTRTLNETGNILVESGYPDLGAFILEALKSGENSVKGNDPDVDVILDQIVRAIPAFRDIAINSGQPVYCLKKALFLLHAINVRFGSSKSSIPIPDTSTLPVFTDNVLPSLLVHLGVIDLSQSSFGLHDVFPTESNDLDKLLAMPKPTGDIVAALPKEMPIDGPTLSTEQAYILRAAAVDACEMILEVAHSLDVAQAPSWLKDIKLPDLDMWLWSVAKDRNDYRRLPRFVLRDTVMF